MVVEKVPLYPHTRIVAIAHGRVMVRLSYDKRREIFLYGTKITVVNGKKAGSYALYQGELMVSSWESDDVLDLRV